MAPAALGANAMSDWKPPEGEAIQLAEERQRLELTLEHIDELDEAGLDALPVGLIKLDRKGNVLSYNKTEADLARIDQRATIGRNFFYDIAPCTRVRAFHGRFLEGVARRELNETFGFVFKFLHGARYVAVTLTYSARHDAVWVIVANARAP